MQNIKSYSVIINKGHYYAIMIHIYEHCLPGNLKHMFMHMQFFNVQECTKIQMTKSYIQKHAKQYNLIMIIYTNKSKGIWSVINNIHCKWHAIWLCKLLFHSHFWKGNISCIMRSLASDLYSWMQYVLSMCTHVYNNIIVKCNAVSCAYFLLLLLTYRQSVTFLAAKYTKWCLKHNYKMYGLIIFRKS
jgi:hypothetical protein